MTCKSGEGVVTCKSGEGVVTACRKMMMIITSEFSHVQVL